MTTAENPTPKIAVTAGETSPRAEHEPKREATPGGLQSSIFWAYADMVGTGLYPLLFTFDEPVVVNRFSQVLASMTPLDSAGTPMIMSDINFEIRQIVPGNQQVDIWLIIHSAGPVSFRTNLVIVN